MRPCSRVGVNLGWRCNWSCTHCFYRFDSRLHQDVEAGWSETKAKIDRAWDNHLDHVVLVGYGEPAIARLTPRVLDYAHDLQMATSMITNGICKLNRYKAFYRQGLDHLHISSHGFAQSLRAISGAPAAFGLQEKLKGWLKSEDLPWRTNVAMQRLNYSDLPELAEYEASLGVAHYVLLGFLPHYQWAEDPQRIREVAVHPAELRPALEQAAAVLESAGTLFTIRYHPLCHLAPRWWKYVVNARYVFFDPFEWNYTLQIRDRQLLWKEAVKLGDAVRVDEPCNRCAALRHCGGWNRIYAAAFGGADLKPIEAPPAEYAEVWDRDGGLHDLNPANHQTGTLRK